MIQEPSKPKVLLLDDDRYYYDEVVVALSEKFEVHWADSVAKFEEKIRGDGVTEYCAFLVDWILDTTTGETASKLLDGLTSRGLKNIVVLSSLEEPSLVRELRKKEIFLYSKWFLRDNPGRLVELINDYGALVLRTEEDGLDTSDQIEKSNLEIQRKVTTDFIVDSHIVKGKSNSTLQTISHQTRRFANSIHAGFENRGLLTEMGAFLRSKWELLRCHLEMWGAQRTESNSQKMDIGDAADYCSFYMLIAGSLAMEKGLEVGGQKSFDFIYDLMAESGASEAAVAKLYQELGEPALEKKFKIDLQDKFESLVCRRYFAAVYIQCLAQAVFHSIRIKCEEPEIFFVPKVVVSYNQDVQRFSFVVHNPGRKRPDFLAAPKDVAELVQLGTYYLGSPNLVSGPKWNEVDKTWRTSFEVGVHEGSN